LTKSLPKKGKQDFCVDTKAFVEAGWMIQEHELEVFNPKTFIFPWVSSFLVNCEYCMRRNMWYSRFSQWH
jgi:hypothetical protein